MGCPIEKEPAYGIMCFSGNLEIYVKRIAGTLNNKHIASAQRGQNSKGEPTFSKQVICNT